MDSGKDKAGMVTQYSQMRKLLRDSMEALELGMDVFSLHKYSYKPSVAKASALLRPCNVHRRFPSTNANTSNDASGRTKRPREIKRCLT